MQASELTGWEAQSPEDVVAHVAKCIQKIRDVAGVEKPQWILLPAHGMEFRAGMTRRKRQAWIYQCSRMFGGSVTDWKRHCKGQAPWPSKEGRQ